MFNWFKKKEVFREICIPKVFLDNGIDFRYQHSIEIATIQSKSKSIFKDIAKFVQENDSQSLKDLSSTILNEDSIKIYSLIGSQENQRMLIAILNPVKKGEEPRLVAYNLMSTSRQMSIKKVSNF
ncbi:MAG: hypothetical protein JJ892_00825 [Balneola sp.]|nr:hypothetical protein [Balneola sp.]MBO6650786.1 hypothetical protein [Balneola sp.]MBO6710105.1 hypothetical protein [Balneola sp.]MBO6798789.1 hypothetical protein [Balneola sp.]MBO6869903.1 hypothetical protein [Balneola sp.]